MLLLSFLRRKKSSTAVQTASPASSTGQRDIYEKYRRQGIRIGKDCIIQGTTFDALAPFLITLEDRVALSGNVTILTHDGTSIYADGVARFAPVTIRSHVDIGQNALILPGVTIGPNSIVGAGSVVTRDVPPGEVWAGNPARFIRTIAEHNERVRKKPGVWFVPMDYRASPEDPEYRKETAAWKAHVRRLHAEGFFDRPPQPAQPQAPSRKP